MRHITKKYRSYYAGEDIIVERKLVDGNWKTTTEHVPTKLKNKQISNTAIVIGNGTNRLDFDLTQFKKPSGLLGSKTVQTYGCNAVYRDFSPDFLIALGNNGIVDEIADRGYTNEHIVYSNTFYLLEFPGQFYLIPYDIHADAGTTAAYIAAFDEHKRIYLLGFDGHEPGNWNNNVYAGTRCYDPVNFSIDDSEWLTNRRSLFNTYNDVDWVWVTPKGTNTIPEVWKDCVNLRQINFRQLVLECDL